MRADSEGGREERQEEGVNRTIDYMHALICQIIVFERISI